MSKKDEQLIWEAYTEGWRDAGHVALDVGGAAADFAFPGAGAIFDIPNALWHAKHGEYIMATLSVISLIPYVGDVIGKGGKAVGYLAKAAKALKNAGKSGRVAAKGITRGRKAVVKVAPKVKAVKEAIYANRDQIDKLFDKMEEDEKWAKHIPEMRKALDNFQSTPDLPRRV